MTRELISNALRAVLFLLAAMLGMTAAAQSPAPLANPNLQFYVDGEVYALARQADGGIVIGGLFTSVNGVPRQYIARLLPDGTVDPVWNPSADYFVEALAVDGNGDVYAGGWFTTIGGQSRSYIAKLSGTGTGAADPDWNPSANAYVQALAVDSNGAVYAGGLFSNIGGQARVGIAQLAGTGSGQANAAWNANAVVFFVRSLAVDSSDAVYVGGSFTTIGGQPRSNLAKLLSAGNGAADANWNPSPDAYVQALTLDGDGFLYVGGSFSTIGNQSRNRIARLSTTGSGDADPTWDPSADDDVLALAVDSGGAVYAGGRFLNIGGQSRAHFAKLMNSGSGLADAGWAIPTDDIVRAIVVSGASVYAGGHFSHVDDLPRWGLAMFDGSGTLGPARDAEISSASVYDTALQPDGGLIVAGSFLKANDQHRAYLLRLGPDGTLDPEWNPSADREVIHLAVDSSGSVYASGQFTSIGGQSRSGLAKIAGSGIGAVDSVWNPAPDGAVYSIAVDDFDSVYVGGVFGNIGGKQRTRIAKLASTGDGAADPTWAPQSTGGVYALAFAQNGDVYAGGSFSNIGGQPRLRIARLSGTGTGAADPFWNSSANLPVSALAVAADGSVFAAGDFSNIGGQPRSHLAKLSDSDGSADLNWNPSPNDSVASLAIDSNGAVYVSGYFSSVGGQPRDYLARLSGVGNGEADTSWNPSASTYVRALTIVNDGSIIAGGAFSMIGGQPRFGIAALPTDNDLIFRNGFEAAAGK